MACSKRFHDFFFNLTPPYILLRKTARVIKYMDTQIGCKVRIKKALLCVRHACTCKLDAYSMKVGK